LPSKAVPLAARAPAPAPAQDAAPDADAVPDTAPDAVITAHAVALRLLNGKGREIRRDEIRPPSVHSGRGRELWGKIREREIRGREIRPPSVHPLVHVPSRGQETRPASVLYGHPLAQAPSRSQETRPAAVHSGKGGKVRPHEITYGHPAHAHPRANVAAQEWVDLPMPPLPQVPKVVPQETKNQPVEKRRKSFARSQSCFIKTPEEYNFHNGDEGALGNHGTNGTRGTKETNGTKGNQGTKVTNGTQGTKSRAIPAFTPPANASGSKVGAAASRRATFAFSHRRRHTFDAPEAEGEEGHRRRRRMLVHSRANTVVNGLVEDGEMFDRRRSSIQILLVSGQSMVVLCGIVY
jgi:hypothetical protein